MRTTIKHCYVSMSLRYSLSGFSRLIHVYIYRERVRSFACVWFHASTFIGQASGCERTCRQAIMVYLSSSSSLGSPARYVPVSQVRRGLFIICELNEPKRDKDPLPPPLSSHFMFLLLSYSFLF